jgi:hypothetical protein
MLYYFVLVKIVSFFYCDKGLVNQGFMWGLGNIFNFLWVCVWWFKNNPATLHSQTTAEGLWEREKG